MNFVKQMILEQVRYNFIHRKYITPSTKDTRFIRWELRLNKSEELANNDDENSGCWERMKQKLKNCTEQEDELDFNSISLTDYFSNL